ncbi:MAG: hypothetical protein P4L55_22105 [Syntrophobacteraceae bacterium]|nr:hypothetical protein [Syntrophobacteraceae bacterium]
MDEKTIEEAIEYLHVFSRSLGASSRFIRLDDESAYCVLGAAAYMGRFEKMRCFDAQRVFARLPGAGLKTESDLRSWIAQYFSPVNARRWDSTRKRAQEFLSAGIMVFVPVEPSSAPVAGPPLPQRDSPECPGILFGKGCPPGRSPLLAVFNSRKPRLVSPDSKWLDVMRSFLHALDRRGIGLAGSTGTLTYDLASVFALRRGLLQLLVAPFPLLTAKRQLRRTFGDDADRIPVISCMLHAASCPAKLSMRCRDRLLADLADFHLILEIRSRGNLLAVLEQIQSKSPRPQFVLKPETPRAANAGNFTLLKDFAEHAIGFKSPRPREPVRIWSAAASNSPRPSGNLLRGLDRAPRGNVSQCVSQGDYLFHYTRACGGPWPGETYRQYLLGLLETPSLRGRSALDVLVRIAREGLLRAGCRMIRGGTPVVCWSSLPPHELFLIRKWRQGFARWTVEPYGVAVRRDVLRSLGAKPAVYGSEQVYSVLPDSEKYRFQVSSSGLSAAWRHEREWRIAEDLALGGIKPHQGFYFVQTTQEAEKLNGSAALGLPVVAMDE